MFHLMSIATVLLQVFLLRGCSESARWLSERGTSAQALNSNSNSARLRNELGKGGLAS